MAIAIIKGGLYLAALSVEADEALAAEMAEWEPATVADGVAIPSGDGAAG